MKDHYDICVAGFWYGMNYGSLLNGYAMYKIFKGFGKEVLMLQKPNAKEEDPEITSGHNVRFINKYYDPDDISLLYSYDKLKELNNICDCFCAGSDQIWNYNLSFHENLYMPFVRDGKKCISFSTSFGHKNDKAPDEARGRLKKYFQRYSAISVREQFDVDILHNNYGVNATLLFEPVFCIDKKYYNELASYSSFAEEEPYLLTYILDPTEEKRKAIQYYSKKSGLKIVNILNGVEYAWLRNKKLLNLPNTLENVGAEDFLKAFMNANFVITDSFHGSAFSIIFNKPFIGIGNYGRGFERFVDLFERLKIMDRLISDPQKIPFDEKYLMPVDYTETNKIIETEAKKTIDWVKRVIETPKEKLPSVILPEGGGKKSRTFDEDKITRMMNGDFSNEMIYARNRISREWKKDEKEGNFFPEFYDNFQLNKITIPSNKNTVANVVLYEKCTGCGSCKNACPVAAIEMKKDKDGFYRYVIDEDACIDCGRCQKCCPVENPIYTKAMEPKCYAFMAEDEIREISSSGGAFTVFAEDFIVKGGYVAGAIYKKNFMPVHIVSNVDSAIGKMRGSKYIQSDTGLVFKQIKTILKDGKKVLFTGLPCQVAGLNGYLGKEYNNLLTVELFCHGITSTKVFERYVKDVLQNDKIISLEFKKKTPWGWHAGVNAEFEDGSEYRVALENDPYFQAYLRGISKNTACGVCKFNRLPRQADLSIGDFWLIEKFKKELNDNKGTSAILINTEKGDKFYQGLSKRVRLSEEVPISYAKQGNAIISRPYKLHFRRDKFFRELDYIGFSKLTNHCKNNIFDVGIISGWYKGYGQALSCISLAHALNTLGFDSIVLNVPDSIPEGKYKYKNIETFIRTNNTLSGLHNNFDILNKHCESFMSSTSGIDDIGAGFRKDIPDTGDEKTLDPILLCADYIITNFGNSNDVNEKNVLFDIVESDESIFEFIEETKNTIFNEYEHLGISNVENIHKYDLQFKTVEEWILSYKKASFIVCDSFYGVCLAILFHKQFMVIKQSTKSDFHRIIDILQMLKIEKREVTIDADMSVIASIIKGEIDYTKVEKIIDLYKEKSYKWLEKTLRAGKKYKIVNYEQIPENYDSALYCVARTAAINSKGRQIITWGDNPELRRILKDCFGIEIPFWVAKNPEYVNGKTILSFNTLQHNNDKYYVIIPDVVYNENDYKLLISYGYLDILDFVYCKHKPLMIKSSELVNGEYLDDYGNKIIGMVNNNVMITISGCNNFIEFGEGVVTRDNMNLVLWNSATVKIGSKTAFNNPLSLNVYATNGKLQIGEGCHFRDGQINIFDSATSMSGSEVLIGDRCSFEGDLEITCSTGRKVIVGEDCMFSHTITLQGGDGHAIFDVQSGERSNAASKIGYNRNELLVIGKHVWVGKRVMVLSGTNIGDGSICGAGSVVKGEYPNNCVIAGNPSKLVKKDISWARDNNATDINSCGEAVNITSSSKAPISGLNVLVLGGTKFMGVHLVNELLKRGNAVTIATRGNKQDNYGNNVKRIKLDRANEESVKNALNGKYYDVIFDNLAYCSTYVKYLLDYVSCGKYIQISSIATYAPMHINTKEKDFNPWAYPQKWVDTKASYVEGKKQAECAVFQRYLHIQAVAVRIPYVTPTERLLYYCKNILKEKPMQIDTMNRGLTFIKSQEVGTFLPWIAGQNFTGPINLASTGNVTIGMIIDYIEKKTGKKAIISNNGEPQPLDKNNTFSINMGKAEKIGYQSSKLDDWFWRLLDRYIEQAHKE